MVLWQNQGGKERNPDEISSYHLARGNWCVESELGEPRWTREMNSTQAEFVCVLLRSWIVGYPFEKKKNYCKFIMNDLFSVLIT